MIARIGKGIAVYVGETEKPDHKLMTLLRAARGSVVQDISIDWGVPEECIETSKGVDDFELVSSEDAPSPGYPKDVPPISFFDVKAIPNIEEEKSKLGPNSEPVGLPPLPRTQQAPASDGLP
ncbi:MAG TPA: hypothetical protein VGO47_00310, partial [Chlamydiales bacterium]|nr:hypothetical protein [Chlamydiales bacterium]